MKNEVPSINDWKIWYPYQIFYIESLLSLTNRITSDYEMIDFIITDNEKFEKRHLMLIDLAENIINLSAAISRYLKPTKTELIHKLRGEKLREHLNIENDNVLLSRKIRNFIEHFDENLDEFLQKPIAGNFLPKAVVLTSSELNEVTFVFKCYIVNEFKYKTLDREVELLPIIKEVYRVHKKLIEFRDNGGRLK